MKRSNAPVFWSLFGAGGMLAALVGAALVFVTGIAAPLADHAYDYANVLALARRGAPLVFGVVALFLWHAAHRIFHTLHDFGVHAGAAAKAACYGGAAAGTAAAAWLLLALRT
jgi:fumarate reductase subunit D